MILSDNNEVSLEGAIISSSQVKKCWTILPYNVEVNVIT